VSNLTQYKLFIGDDKKNTISGVTFSFKKTLKKESLTIRTCSDKGSTYFSVTSKTLSGGSVVISSPDLPRENPVLSH